MTTLILCWNEKDLIRHTVEYYKQFGHVIVFDNHSTDGSDEIASRYGAEVRKFGNDKLDDREYLKIKNHAYKEIKDDWVCIVDADEYIYHPSLTELLKDNRYNFFSVRGWNIYSETFAKPFEITTGFWDVNFNKSVLFRPNIDINYGYGAHRCSPKGNIRVNPIEIYLFHYRCMGGVQRMIDRHKAYAQRMCDYNIDLKLGGHYLRSEQQIIDEWNNNIAKSVKFAL